MEPVSVPVLVANPVIIEVFLSLHITDLASTYINSNNLHDKFLEYANMNALDKIKTQLMSEGEIVNDYDIILKPAKFINHVKGAAILVEFFNVLQKKINNIVLALKSIESYDSMVSDIFKYVWEKIEKIIIDNSEYDFTKTIYIKVNEDDADTYREAYAKAKPEDVIAAYFADNNNRLIVNMKQRSTIDTIISNHINAKTEKTTTPSKISYVPAIGRTMTEILAYDLTKLESIVDIPYVNSEGHALHRIPVVFDDSPAAEEQFKNFMRVLELVYDPEDRYRFLNYIALTVFSIRYGTITKPSLTIYGKASTGKTASVLFAYKLLGNNYFTSNDSPTADSSAFLGSTFDGSGNVLIYNDKPTLPKGKNAAFNLMKADAKGEVRVNAKFRTPAESLGINYKIMTTNEIICKISIDDGQFDKNDWDFMIVITTSKKGLNAETSSELITLMNGITSYSSTLGKRPVFNKFLLLELAKIMNVEKHKASFAKPGMSTYIDPVYYKNMFTNDGSAEIDRAKKLKLLIAVFKEINNYENPNLHLFDLFKSIGIYVSDLEKNSVLPDGPKTNDLKNYKVMQSKFFGIETLPMIPSLYLEVLKKLVKAENIGDLFNGTGIPVPASKRILTNKLGANVKSLPQKCTFYIIKANDNELPLDEANWLLEDFGLKRLADDIITTAPVASDGCDKEETVGIM